MPSKKNLKVAAWVVGIVGIAFLIRRVTARARLTYRTDKGELKSYDRPLSREHAAIVTNDCVLATFNSDKAPLISALYSDAYSELATICEASMALPR